MAFTDLLDALGGVGRFQLIYTALLLLPCGLLACHNFLQNFTAAMPPHHCRGPANLTNTSEAWLRAAVPVDRLGALDSCRRFTEPQWVLLLPNASSSHRAATEGCVDGWEYDRSVFPSTIVTEWDLVCEARTLRDLAQSIYMAGVLLGAAVFGSLADRLGRKAPLVWSYLQLAVSGAATAYVSSFSAYCVFRFLMGMTFSGIILNSLSLVVEWMPARGRTVAGILLGVSFTLGQLVLAGVAYLIRPWRWLQFAVSAPFLIFFFYSWWLPESSRWLLLHGKSQQALQNLRKVAALNGREEESKRLTTEAVSAYVQSEFASVRTSSSVLDLFRTPAIRKVTCCLVGVWFSNSVAYYGLAMDLHKFGLSLYLVQALFGIIDIPAMLLATITMIYVGRRATVASFLIMAGLTVIANMFVPEGEPSSAPALTMRRGSRTQGSRRGRCLGPSRARFWVWKETGSEQSLLSTKCPGRLCRGRETTQSHSRLWAARPCVSTWSLARQHVQGWTGEGLNLCQTWPWSRGLQTWMDGAPFSWSPWKTPVPRRPCQCNGNLQELGPPRWCFQHRPGIPARSRAPDQ
ncbi:solute carrier family 22 member 20 isoform X1 [Oryctolagus cuniculus]|uniref:solute carrier family 22 member 20 isoform X1 n=1 Tax=Oryctolagus cuniculus TaxID=9986 RepID=UPI0038796BA4